VPRGDGFARAIAVAILPALAIVEALLGQPALCRCGRLRLWTGRADGPETSQMLVDWYSASHIVHGLLFYGILRRLAPELALGWRLLLATLIEAAWELTENSPAVIARYRATTIAIGYSGDSVVNSVSDVAMMMLGFAFAAAVSGRLSILAAIALELASLIAIRDNLTLNVLMLAHPIDAIRRWQAG
jgi:hypothetical protein